VHQEEADCPADGRVGPTTGAERTEAAVEAEVVDGATVDDHERRDGMRRRLHTFEIQLRVTERSDRRHENGHDLGWTPGEHGVDRDRTPGGSTVAGREHGDGLVGVARK
jgi:hypothetical protein